MGAAEIVDVYVSIVTTLEHTVVPGARAAGGRGLAYDSIAVEHL